MIKPKTPTCSGLLLIILPIIYINFGCQNNANTPRPDPLQEQADKLAGTWSATSITNNGNGITNQFRNFDLILKAGKTFTTDDADNIWPPSGSYTFKNEDLNLLIRSDGIEMVLSNLTTPSMTLSFTIPTTGGRTTGITGNFIFQLIRQ